MTAKSRTAPDPPPAAGGLAAALRRVPWWAVVTTAVVLLSANFMTEPLRDAANFQPVTEVSLAHSAAYLVLAPLCDVFDTLSLMTVPQHLAIVVTLALLFVGWRVRRGWRRGGTSPVREARAVVFAVFGLLLFYAVGIVVPRPMARLVVSPPLNQALIVVDFHSHTKYSHDGAPWFTPEANRRWHRDAGFDAAYVTDHRTVQGAEDARRDNPRIAGEGTTILQGLEVVWQGAHVNLLGAQQTFSGLTDPNLRDIDDKALTLASMIPHHEPVLIFTFPGMLRYLHPATAPGTPGVRAIEIVDGSPRGLTDTRRLRTTIATIAAADSLALVAGSDNHGWGYTAPAWTLMLLPGWRGMTPDSLAGAIDDAVRSRGFEATEVVERRVANTGRSTARLAATVPLVAWRALTMLTDNERVAWLIWIWGSVLVGTAWRRRRAARPPAA
ncbi:MAG: hypothetical protein KGL38_01840 [Gemmatimonadota bacterium]|nr:hypothetical protein [Gemmatimonadota bacterium]